MPATKKRAAKKAATTKLTGAKHRGVVKVQKMLQAALAAHAETEHSSEAGLETVSISRTEVLDMIETLERVDGRVSTDPSVLKKERASRR